MNKIEVYRTHVRVNDYELGDCLFIEKTFSIWDPLYHKRFYKGMYYDKETKILYLPRGVDIFRLEKYYDCLAHVSQSNDPVRKIPPVTLKYGPRDNDQKEAIKFMLGMDQYRHNLNHTRLTLNLNTGKGKSYCAIATVAYKGLVTAIITDTIGCLEQWQGYFTEYTDVKPDEILYLSGSANIAKLYRMDINKYKVFLMPHATLQSYGSTFGWEKVHDLFKYLGIGIKIYDEAHLDFDNMMMIDSYTDTYLTYYLTATLGRSDPFENAIYQIYFNGVPSINLFHEDVDPHTAYVGIKYNSKPTAMDISNCKNSYGLNRSNYANYVVHQENFYNVLHVLVNQALRKPGKCLWYIGTNEAILHVRDWLYDNYPELIRQVGIYTSLIDDKEKKREQLDRKIILTTTKSAGAALDIKNLVEVVNLAEPFKSRVLAQQSFGRTRDKNTIYKDIVDLGFKQTRAYYNFKKPVFSKYATSCKEVILRDNELKKLVDEIKARRASYIYPITIEDDRKG